MKRTPHFKKILAFAAQSTLALFLFAPLVVSAQQPVGGPAVVNVTDPAATPPKTTTQPPATTAGTDPKTSADPKTTNSDSAAAGDSAPQENGTGSFVPLTQLPGISDAANAATLPAFFNQIYRIAIGAGAVLAVLSIMYGGVLIMTSRGSVSSNEKAKSRIQNAILGLVLILSPTIVFGIINPSILSLDFTKDIQNLQLKDLSNVDTSSPVAGQFSGADAYLWEHSGDPKVDAQRCTTSGGTLVFECRKKDESGGRQVGANDTCNADENKYNQCKASGEQPLSGTQCQDLYTNITSQAITSNNKCSAENGFVSVPHGCCTGAAAAGNLCCARPKGTQFMLAYYYTKKNTSTNSSCYVDSVQLFPSPASCSTAKSQAQTARGTVENGTTRSDIVFVKSCESTKDSNFKVTAPNNLPHCP